MNVIADPSSMQSAIGRFAIGQPVSRKEDPVLLRGEGQYSDDVSWPGQLYAVMVRSRHAHGILREVDAHAARALPGVHAVITAAELAEAGLTRMAASPQKNRDGSDAPIPPQGPLARTKVRYVGDPVAMVVADTAQIARDAAELVTLDVDPLPAVTWAPDATSPGAPVLHDQAPGNVALDFHYGNTAAVDAAFARAAHVSRLRLVNSRVVVAPLEPRSGLARMEPDGRFTIRLGTQGVFGFRAGLAKLMNMQPKQLRVLTGNVGGSFGMKASVYPEYVCLLHAARVTGRPVKWTDDRTDSFVSDSHGRDHVFDAALALDEDGRFLAVRAEGWGNLGAYLGNAAMIPSTSNIVKNMVGVYATPLIEVSSRCVFTNTTPVGAYRGAGRPEGNFFMERLVDQAAAEMGIDRVELRRRNHIAALPHAAPSGMNYDSGDFANLLDHALAAADWDGYPARRAESRARGKLRGRGIGQYLEVTAPPSSEMGGIRFEPNGDVTIVTGTLDYGQGHATPFAQVLVDRLGVPFDRVRLLQGDSDQLIAGGGTGGSKSIMASGAAIVEASALVVERGRQLASDLLEAAAADIEFEPASGLFTIAGTDRSVGIMELAAHHPSALSVEHMHEQAPSAFPNGCHVAEVEVDPETGEAQVVRYTMANDFGVLINPMLVEGQAHGGVVQGIGQALMERTAYDADGQFLSGSFLDYQLPRASDLPSFAFSSHPSPARTNVLGAKGCGEAGCAGALPAVMNAMADAVGRPVDMPATAEAVWRLLQERQGA